MSDPQRTRPDAKQSGFPGLLGTLLWALLATAAHVLFFFALVPQLTDFFRYLNPHPPALVALQQVAPWLHLAVAGLLVMLWRYRRNETVRGLILLALTLLALFEFGGLYVLLTFFLPLFGTKGYPRP
ncbi:MAG: hypothetical protein JSR82_02725 [Verrucomicrobia bacterium]|nr:hypothetical protein [Verrucomicrobiota bacterium]